MSFFVLFFCLSTEGLIKKRFLSFVDNTWMGGGRLESFLSLCLFSPLTHGPLVLFPRLKTVRPCYWREIFEERFESCVLFPLRVW